MKVEEHKAFFIIVIISSIKMTIGSKFKPGLPKCSMWQLLILVSSFFPEAIYFSVQIQQTNTNVFAYSKTAVTGSCW